MLLWRRCTLLHQMRRWFVQRTADFAHDRVARKPELAQNFTSRAHYLWQIVGWNHDQRDQENQEYFEYTQVQIAQMPIPLLPGGSYVPNPMPALSYSPRPSVRATDRLIFAVVRA
jgi:hypothetical protein